MVYVRCALKFNDLYVVCDLDRNRQEVMAKTKGVLHISNDHATDWH